MDEHDEHDDVIRRLIQWGTGQEAVRAILLTSTRVVPGASFDTLSDYDVILVLRDIGPFVADHRWANDFGDVLVGYWDPVERDPGSGVELSGNVIQYVDALKIDFSLWPIPYLTYVSALPALPAELDAGYRVLLDKDGLTVGLPDPTYTGYRLSPPDEATYQTLINDFFIGVPYVAKCLLRNDILPAKWCLDYDMRYVYLLPILEWRAGCDHNWSISPGVNGKGLKRYLPEDIWTELEGTYAGAAVEDTWTSLFRVIALFRRASREVGAHLGFRYPEELGRRVRDHARWMQDGMDGPATTS